jgi:predicted  nucleic acid-binding Zn-ribbon protein
MNADVSTALRIQELDQKIAALKREIAALPRQVAEIEKALESHTRRLELDKAALAANQKERKKLDGDVQTQQQKISKLKDQMLQAKTNEQYRAFQHEIEFCEKEIGKFEDRILELMEEAESLEKNVKAAEVALAEEKKVVGERKAEAKARTDADRVQLAECEAERGRLASSLPPALLTSYERLRAKFKDGLAIAEAAEGRCTACNLTLRPQFYAELKASAEVMFCENCKRILYIQPQPVDVDSQMNV